MRLSTILNHKHLAIVVIHIICIATYAQKSNPFRSQYQTSQIRSYNVSLTHSDTISLKGLGKIYALSIDATICQPQESSFSRIVLEDVDGQDYLVAESDWFRNDTTIVNLTGYCEETAKLEGIMPLRLKIYLAANASVVFSSINTATSPTAINRKTNSMLDIKRSQIESIVGRINTYNKRHGKMWRAGISEEAMKSYSEAKLSRERDGGDAFTNNLYLYHRGIYELGERDSLVQESVSLCVDSFDWSNRHGKNWITLAKNQGLGPFCQTFAAVGMTESVSQLYYNDTTTIDLSEQDVSSHIFNGNANWHSLATPISYIIHNGVIDEASLPYEENNPEPEIVEPRPDGDERISFRYYDYDFILNPSEVENVKKDLINKGPCAVGIATHLEDNLGHAILIYGYESIYEGQTWLLDEGNNQWSNPIELGDNRIGYTYWKFKNSWGTDWGYNGHGYIICYDYPNYMDQFFFIDSSISSLTRSDADIICEDADGDGYFYWGIKSGIPSSLPPWAPRQKDGDDSNCSIGPLRNFGHPTIIHPDSLDTVYIDCDTTFNTDCYLGNNICIRNQSKLTISSRLVMNHLSKITVESGSIIQIDGGIVQNATINPESGSSIILDHDGKIILYRDQDFNPPLGVSIQIINGSIIPYQHTLL